MEFLPKSRPVFILSVLSVFLFAFNIGSCINSYSQGAARRKEMAQRLGVEEKMLKLGQEKTALLEKLKAKEKESEEERVAFQSTKKALLQEQLVCQALKEELQKVTNLKEVLEEDLKKALITSNKAKKMR